MLEDLSCEESEWTSVMTVSKCLCVKRYVPTNVLGMWWASRHLIAAITATFPRPSLFWSCVPAFTTCFLLLSLFGLADCELVIYGLISFRPNTRCNRCLGSVGNRIAFFSQLVAVPFRVHDTLTLISLDESPLPSKSWCSAYTQPPLAPLIHIKARRHHRHYLYISNTQPNKEPLQAPFHPDAPCRLCNTPSMSISHCSTNLHPSSYHFQWIRCRLRHETGDSSGRKLGGSSELDLSLGVRGG